VACECLRKTVKQLILLILVQMQGARPLPIWLQQRLYSTFDSEHVRYEASQYGPLNGMLGHVFPVERCFMVKPQAKIRPPYTRVTQPDIQPDAEDFSQGTETLTRVSIDSMGDFTVSRAENPARAISPITNSYNQLGCVNVEERVYTY